MKVQFKIESIDESCLSLQVLNHISSVDDKPEYSFLKNDKQITEDRSIYHWQIFSDDFEVKLKQQI